MRIHVALLLSGIAALIHELMWVRLLGQMFGHTIFAVQTVLTVFFLGIALGAWIAGRMGMSRPFVVFAVIEIGIAVWGVLLPSIVRGLTSVYDRFAPLESETLPAVAVRLAITIVALLVPATLMGATFPIVATATRRIAAVYAINTLGGAAGVVLAAFVVLPRVGVTATILIASSLNVVAAAFCAGLRRAPEPAGSSAAEQPPALDHAALLLFLTGLSALALELLWTRALEQILSGTVYTFAVVLAVFLAGIAIGGFILRKMEATRERLGLVLAALAFAIVLTPGVVFVARGAHESLGGGPAVEAAVAALLLLVPAALMGMSFPLLVTLGRGSIGRLTAANTFGSVIGPLAAALILPLAGLRTAIVVFAVVTASVAIAVSRRAGLVALVAVLVAIPLATRPLRIAADRGETLVAYRDDSAATVAVVRRGNEQRLKVNNTYSLGGGRGIFTERRQGHLPMFLHPHPDRVLILGIGTGNTAGAVALHSPTRLVAVDLLPGVVEFAKRYFAGTNGGVLGDGRTEVLVADATRIVRSSPEAFDVIVGDLFHPWQAGVGALYSREHFTNVRGRLAPRGVFVQWLPLYQLSTRDVRSIARTFLDVFPHAEAWLGNFGASTPILALAGSLAPIDADERSLVRKQTQGPLGDQLRAVDLDHLAELRGSYVCDRTLLARFANGAPLNTADRPLLEFTAASALFEARLESEKRQTLKELVKLAAAQDRADRVRGASGREPAYFDNRLAVRAFITTFLALEEGKYSTAVETALIAAEKSVGYDLPERTLPAVGWEVLDADRAGAERLFLAALRSFPNDVRAREGLERARSRF